MLCNTTMTGSCHLGASLVTVMLALSGWCLLQVTTESEAAAAVAAAKQLHDHFVLIEVIVDKRDAAPGAALLRAGICGEHFR